MRSLAPRDPGLPSGLAARLTIDPEPRVRRAIAAHPNLPLRDLVRLLADETEWVAHAAAGSSKLPLDQMERLLALALACDPRLGRSSSPTVYFEAHQLPYEPP